MARAAEAKGKLRIGDDWNAIRIIALSQSNPLKAIAELVENSIDAHARKITITRGREHGEHYLAIRDDCRLQVNRRLDHFRPRFLQLNRRLNLLFAAKS
jgi:hypothetical protein